MGGVEGQVPLPPYGIVPGQLASWEGRAFRRGGLSRRVSIPYLLPEGLAVLHVGAVSCTMPA